MFTISLLATSLAETEREIERESCLRKARNRLKFPALNSMYFIESREVATTLLEFKLKLKIKLKLNYSLAFRFRFKFKHHKLGPFCGLKLAIG